MPAGDLLRLGGAHDASTVGRAWHMSSCRAWDVSRDGSEPAVPDKRGSQTRLSAVRLAAPRAGSP